MKHGGSIGGKIKGRKYPKEGAPLRKIVNVIIYYSNIFQPNRVLLECGHETNAWGQVRARCSECKKLGNTAHNIR